jgi:hypothetical protein
VSTWTWSCSGCGLFKGSVMRATPATLKLKAPRRQLHAQGEEVDLPVQRQAVLEPVPVPGLRLGGGGQEDGARTAVGLLAPEELDIARRRLVGREQRQGVVDEGRAGLRSPSRPTSPMNVSLKTNRVGVAAPGVSCPERGME